MSVTTVPWNSGRGWDLSIEPNLTRAELHEANLVRANLARAVLAEAGLMSANLDSANLFRAILFRADLMWADLIGANLAGAGLTQEELEPATGDENTWLPPDLKPPAHWNVKTDEQIEGD